MIKHFYLKGDGRGYDVGDKYIYIGVLASNLGYENTPDEYLAAIDRDTQEVKIINRAIKTPSLGSLSVNPVNKNIYTLVLNPDTGDSTLFVYSEKGDFLKEIKLEIKWANYLHINSRGIAYITYGYIFEHANKPHGVLVMDTSGSEKIIGKIDTPKGPCNMTAADNYLFVANFPSDSVSVIDMGRNELLANMEGVGDGESSVDEIVVIKY
ncbi:MAG: hypothetical protein C4589_00340 [Peptococcaceae bacterium]|nr:MAG: hypothetical protein C4589_00340 [Peptococcaceae bacterium]